MEGKVDSFGNLEGQCEELSATIFHQNVETQGILKYCKCLFILEYFNLFDVWFAIHTDNEIPTWQAFFLINLLKLLLTVTWCSRKKRHFLLCFSCSPSCKASRDWERWDLINKIGYNISMFMYNLKCKTWERARPMED